MASWLKQSTSVDVGIGPFLDETDGKTAETALTITQPDIRLKKNGGAWAQKNAAQTLTHEEAGWYEVTLDATDTNTLGLLIVAIHESGALPVWKEYMVVPAMMYDSIVAGSDRLDTNVTHIGDTAQTARDIGASVLLSSGTGTGQVKLSSGYVAPNWGDVGNPTTVVGLTGTTVKTATDVETDTQDIQARLPAALTAGGNIKADALALSGDTVAADNAESFFDGTGYAGTNNVIPTVTNVTNQVTANVTGISGDATAADNLEAMLDGTGGVTLTTAITGNITGNLSGSVGSVTGAVGSVTGNVGGNVAGSVGSVTGNVGGNVAGSVGSVTGNLGGNVAGSVGSVTAAVTVGTNNDKTGYALTASYDFAKGTTAMTEAYAANGAAPTPAEALFAIHQMLMQFAISGTTLTVKKLDNSTTAFEVTLDDATNPSGAARV